MANDSVMDERTLRELYTTGFEIGVKEGQPKSIMTSYNRINGVYANENTHLLQEILVQEWGFDGFVVSDWGGSNDHASGVKNGSHLEMPSTGKAGAEEIIKAVESGKLKEQILDERVDELLQVILFLTKTRKAESGKILDVEKHHQTARKAAAESIVLLKNEGRLLPLAKGTKVAVIGDFAEAPRYQGAGSPVEMPWIGKVKAVVHGYLGGQAGAGAMLDVLTGAICPSGKLNETYPIKYEDTPAFSYYPGPERTSEYREGLYVGYRYKIS